MPICGIYLTQTNASDVAKLCSQMLLSIYRILGEYLLISSLPGKALRTLVDIARLAKRFNMRSQSRAW